MSNYDNVYCLDRFEKEWKDLFKKDSAKTKRKYDEWLDEKLNKLDVDASFNSKHMPKKFEIVQNSNPVIHSIHEKTKKNAKVLYYIITETNKVILLTAFVEKSKSDYNIAKNRAEERVKKYIKGDY